MMRSSEAALYRYLVVWLCAAGCVSNRAGTARDPSRAAAPTADAEARGHWLLHGTVAGPVAAGGYAISYQATWLGPEHAGQSVRLPSAYSVSFSPDGKWLALCAPDPSGAPPNAARRASVIRFEPGRISEPVVFGACETLDWAPTGAHLLLEDESSWKLVELGGPDPIIRDLGAQLGGPVTWSPSGHYFIAPERDDKHALGLVSLLEVEPRARALEWFASPRSTCSWSSADALACAVERQGKPLLVLAQVGDPSAGSNPHVTELDLPLNRLGWGTNRVVTYELVRAGGVYAFAEDLPPTRLFEPGASSGLDYFRLSPTGRWLLECAGQGARLWDLASVPRSVPLSGLSGTLVNPRWSSDGKHALLGVRNAQAGLQQADVWMIAEASTEPKLARLASLAPGQQSIARFSPGSSWVLVSIAGDVPTLAAAGASAARGPAAPRSFAVNIATRTELPLPLGFGDWASDDSAFVVSNDGHLQVFRVRGSTFVGPEELGRDGPGALRLVWQP